MLYIIYYIIYIYIHIECMYICIYIIIRRNMTPPPAKPPRKHNRCLIRKSGFFRPKKQVFLNKTLFGVKAMMASKKVFETLFC